VWYLEYLRGNGSEKAIPEWWGSPGCRRRRAGAVKSRATAASHSVCVQRSSAQISVYTRPIAQFLVGNEPFKWPYVMREGRREMQCAAGGGALDSRAPPAFLCSPYEACRRTVDSAHRISQGGIQRSSQLSLPVWGCLRAGGGMGPRLCSLVPSTKELPVS